MPKFKKNLSFVLMLCIMLVGISQLGHCHNFGWS